MKKKSSDKLTWFQKQLLLKNAGIHYSPAKKNLDEIDEIDDLPQRIQNLLQIVSKPKKSTDMLFIIMYDIEDNKVRTQIAKYLIKEGCIRIQKSVYVAKMQRKHYVSLKETLTEVQQLYDNEDSILIVPVSTDELKAMNIIGKNIDVSLFTNPPNTMFF